MRQLAVIDVSDPRSLWEPLSAALFEEGPAVLPRPGGAKISHTAPLEVPDDTALVIETSGTTGAPKRVALTAEAVLAGATLTSNALGGGSWLLALPAHYIAGIQVCVRAHLAGTTPLFTSPRTIFHCCGAEQGGAVAGGGPRGTPFHLFGSCAIAAAGGGSATHPCPTQR